MVSTMITIPKFISKHGKAVKLALCCWSLFCMMRGSRHVSAWWVLQKNMARWIIDAVQATNGCQALSKHKTMWSTSVNKPKTCMATKGGDSFKQMGRVLYNDTFSGLSSLRYWCLVSRRGLLNYPDGFQVDTNVILCGSIFISPSVT